MADDVHSESEVKNDHIAGEPESWRAREPESLEKPVLLPRINEHTPLYTEVPVVCFTLF